jgi:hypothetical protein
MTIQADFEALQVQAAGLKTPDIEWEPGRGTAVAGSGGGSYGGFFVAQGGTIDATIPTVTRVFKDGSSDAANTVTPTDGALAVTDVWEEYYENNAKAPTFILRAHAGTVFHAPTYGANFTYQQFTAG